MYRSFGVYELKYIFVVEILATQCEETHQTPEASNPTYYDRNLNKILLRRSIKASHKWSCCAHITKKGT